MKRIIISIIFCLVSSEVMSVSSGDKKCEKDSECTITNINCSSCLYDAKWVATNKKYKKFCPPERPEQLCREAIKVPAGISVCRKKECVLKSPQELFDENETFVKKLQSHPLQKAGILKCPQKLGRFYLELPLGATGITKETFFLVNTKSHLGVSSALKCYYRIEQLKNSYAIVTVSFQIIGSHQPLVSFCSRESIDNHSIEFKVDKEFAITTSIKKYFLDGETNVQTKNLKKGFQDIVKIIKKDYALKCPKKI